MNVVVKQLLELGDPVSHITSSSTLIIVLTATIRSHFDSDMVKNKNNILNLKAQLNIMSENGNSTILYLEKLRYLYIYLTYLAYSDGVVQSYDNIILYGLDFLLQTEASGNLNEIIRLTNLMILKLKELTQNYKDKKLNIVILPIDNIDFLNQHFGYEKSIDVQQDLDLIYKIISINSNFF
ncbi:hypothetical protein QEN19_002731 [Hanseniaspora menglaensis]